MEAWIHEFTETGSISDIESEGEVKTDSDNYSDNDSDNESDKVSDNDIDGEAIKSSMAAKISAFEARVVDQDERIAELEQITSFLVGLGLGLGLGLFLLKWMGKA